jgi:hypothetical protein
MPSSSAMGGHIKAPSVKKGSSPDTEPARTLILDLTGSRTVSHTILLFVNYPE